MERLNLKTYRRSFQIFIALAFILIPLVNRSRYSMVYGNFLSFHMFGIPLADPLAVLQLTIKNYYFTIDNFIGTLLPLLVAFTLGTLFCSWICPYGLMSEYTQIISNKILPKSYKGISRTKKGFTVKLTVFLFGFLGFFVFSTTPVLNQLSTAAWYARFFQYYFGQDIISLCFLFLLLLIFIEFFARERIWCRYICPQSVIIIFTKLLNRKRLKVVFDPKKCICPPEYGHCDRACSLHLAPKQLNKSLETECSNCGDCVLACKKMGTALSFEFPLVKNRFISTLIFNTRKCAKSALQIFAVVIIGGVSYQYFQQLEFSKEHEIEHKLLSNKKISWRSERVDSFQLLSSGVLIVSGGEWPQYGSGSWYWQPIDGNGSFKIIPDILDSEQYTVILAGEPIQSNAAVDFQHVGKGLFASFPESSYEIAQISDIQMPPEDAATVDGRVVLSQYANQTFVLNLEVKDPLGLIKKIESEGDHIGMEGMLTNVKKWINSPQIIVSEGHPPTLPFKTRMQVIFHDGHTESMEFITKTFVDRSSEEFEDPWF